MNELERSYEECKRLNALHGKTYYLATLLLPRERRKYVHALYGFARYADEIVDDLASTLTPEEKARALNTWSQTMIEDLKRGDSDDLIGRALVDTVKTFSIPIEYFEAFLKSMAMDLIRTEYATFDDLMEYVYGSAVVIGLEMLPILGVRNAGAESAASKLGAAFQLANFIRDVGEDLDRGRIYLPMDELAHCGVTRADLEKRVLTPQIKAALQFQIERVRTLQREAEEGIPLLDKVSQPCIRAASTLYCGIVDEVEAIGYEVFTRRAKVPRSRRISVASRAYLSALFARINPA